MRLGSRGAIVPPGAISCAVRVNVPGEGRRVSAKVVRWSRVRVGDLAVETAPGGHLIMGSQVEGNEVWATDDGVPAAAAFLLAILGGIDGRPLPDLDAVSAGGAGGSRLAPSGAGRTAASRRAARVG
jgi:hypothetical protein